MLAATTDLLFSLCHDHPTMHSIYSRVNNVSAFLSSCLMALLFAIALSSFLLTANPKGDLAITSIQVFVFTCHFSLSNTLSLVSHFHSQIPRKLSSLCEQKSGLCFSQLQRHRRYTYSPCYPYCTNTHHRYSVDLSPLFNWNTKQLFLYLSAEYTNERGVSVFSSCLPRQFTRIPPFNRHSYLLLGQERRRHLGSHCPQ